MSRPRPISASACVLGLLVALSLAANAVLIASLPSARSAPLAPNDSAPAALDAGGIREPGDRASHISSAVSASLWAELQGNDLRELGRRLLAAGFPDRQVRAVLSDLHERPWRERTEEARDATPYWRNPITAAQPASVEEIHARLRERQQLLIDVFGPTRALWADGGYGTSGYEFLPAEKAGQVLSIQQDYLELLTVEPPKKPADFAAWEQRRKLLEDQQRADLAALLTPEELYEYDLRTSATRVAIQPKFMELTEAEYRGLFAVFHEPMTAQDPRGAQAGGRPRQSWSDLLETLEPQVRAVLGEARYAEYAQAMDRQSERLNRVAARFDLPLSAAAQVAAVRRDVTTRADAIRRDSALGPAQKTAALATLHADATARIGAAFGARAAEAYLRYDGKWLEPLSAPANDRR